MLPIEEVDGRDAPLGVTCITDNERGRKIANLFIIDRDLFLILEPDVAMCITPHAGAFLLKCGRAGRMAELPPCNFGEPFIGRVLTDAKVYPNKIEVEIDLGMAGVDITHGGIFAWTRSKRPAIN